MMIDVAFAFLQIVVEKKPGSWKRVPETREGNIATDYWKFLHL